MKKVFIVLPLITLSVFLGTFLLSTPGVTLPPQVVSIETFVSRRGAVSTELIKSTSGARDVTDTSLSNSPTRYVDLIPTNSGELVYDASGAIPIHPLDPKRSPNTQYYLKEVSEIAEKMRQRWTQNNLKGSVDSRTSKPFKFHIYQIPDKYIHGALKQLEERWESSFCNRHKKKTNYTSLDWRHAHSLFTADVLIAKYLQYHPSHTMDPNEADIFIIPMMPHVYNCAGTMIYATEVLSWVTQYPYYKLYNGHDHYFFWWRWGMHYKSVERFWKRVTNHFRNANIISYDYLELMGRNDWQDFSLAIKPKHLTSQQWIVMPYPDFSPELSTPLLQSEIHRSRKVLFMFAGTSTIGGIRRWIKRNCEAHEAQFKNSSQPHSICYYEDFATSVTDSARLGVPAGYPAQMKTSVFCGHAAGDALSSRRPTSAVLAGCIPVLICDLCIYAFEDTLDYSSFSVFIQEDDIIEGRLMEILSSIAPETIKLLQSNLASVRHHFVYNISGPSQKGDALDLMVSQMSSRSSLLRSYRRWWTINHRLPVDVNAYPLIPPPLKKYLKRGISSQHEESNFNNL